MKKLKLLTILPALLLSSCGEFDPSGTYQFRLGKTDDSHIEVTAVVTNDTHPSVEGMKVMSLTADLGDELSVKSILESYAEKYPIIEPFVNIITKEVENIKEIPLYYKVVSDIQDPKYGYRLSVGTDFLSEFLKKQIEEGTEIGELIESLGFDVEKLNFTPDLFKYLVTAYINSKNLTFQIPVSTKDLEMQTFWYGYSNRIEGDYLDRLPGKQGEERFGSHPVVSKDEEGKVISSEVDEVNKTFEKEFSNTHLYKDDVKIGSFVETLNDGRKGLKLLLDDSYTGSKINIEGKVYTKDLLGEYSLLKSIKISVDDENKVNITHNEKSGIDEGFTDENGTEFKFTDVVQEPYIFRDYHVVNFGLTKI